MTQTGSDLAKRVGLGLGLLVAAACASGGRAFPVSTEPSPHALGRAMAAVAEAVAAGADSLAPEPLKIARQHLAAANTEEQAKHADRAELLAHEAIAEATLAHAQADEITAEHARAAAAQQVEQVSSDNRPAGAHP